VWLNVIAKLQPKSGSTSGDAWQTVFGAWHNSFQNVHKISPLRPLLPSVMMFVSIVKLVLYCQILRVPLAKRFLPAWDSRFQPVIDQSVLFSSPECSQRSSHRVSKGTWLIARLTGLTSRQDLYTGTAFPIYPAGLENAPFQGTHTRTASGIWFLVWIYVHTV
jgi:hypothetical protein